MKVLEAIKIGSNLLKSNRIDSHILDSELLLSKSLNKSREEILINLDQRINKKNFSVFKKYLRRRYNNEPVAYILEEKEFWSKKFYVNKSTLIPRPETEILIDALVNIFKGKNISILDIGTGSGLPGIPLAIFNENKNIYLSEKNNKKKLPPKKDNQNFGNKQCNNNWELKQKYENKK